MYYASRFLAFARAYLPYALGPSINLQIIPQEMPLDARIHLGGKLAGKGAIEADDALVWAVSSPISWRKRWPSDQRDVFEHYWRIRFAARFPAGLSVPRPRERIRAVYQPSSRSFEAQLKGTFENLPDPVSDPSTPEALKALVDECWEDGGSYLGAVRRRDEQSPLSASLLLPAEVWIERNARLLNTFANHLANAGTDVLVLPVIDIFKAADMSVSIAPKTLLAVLRRMSEGLWNVGVGLEPDGVYADADVSFANNACLFKIPEPFSGSGYGQAVNAGARIAVDIGILYAGTADNDEPETRARIAASVADGIGADELERTRLDAYATVAAPLPERQPRLLKKASQLSDELRATAARAVIEGVATKKRLPVQLIRQLEKVYKALNVPTEDLYAALHRAPEADVASPGDADAADVAFEAVRRALEGQAAKTSPSGLAIDPDRLARRKAETDAVSKLLSDVFADSDTPAGGGEPGAPPTGTPLPPDGLFEGLDARHGELLAAILDAGSLARSEVEARAKAMKLFVDAALDHINEWAFDRLDEAVVEDGDEVRVAPQLADRVMSMRKH